MEIINDRIVELVKRQLQLQINALGTDFTDYKLTISTEQQFMNKYKDNLEKRRIYVTVQFLESNINFGQTVMDTIIKVFVDNSGVTMAQMLLMNYVNTYNLASTGSSDLKQVYSSPVPINNFNEYGANYVAIYQLSSTFVYSPNSFPCTLSFYTGETEESTEEVEFINFAFDYNVMLSPNVTDELSRSKAQYGTFSFNISTFLVYNTVLMDKLIKLICGQGNINDIYKFKMIFSNDNTDSLPISMTNNEFKVKAVSQNQSIGEQPIITITFTN